MAAGTGAAGPTLRNEMFLVDWQGVSSTNLSAVAYSPDFQRLWVRFHDQRVYAYHGVPDSVHAGLMAAGSKGQYLDRHVKKAGFGFTRVS